MTVIFRGLLASKLDGVARLITYPTPTSSTTLSKEKEKIILDKKKNAIFHGTFDI